MLKVYERSLSYAEGKPFDFTQSFYTALYSVRHSLLRILLTVGNTVLYDIHYTHYRSNAMHMYTLYKALCKLHIDCSCVDFN